MPLLHFSSRVGLRRLDLRFFGSGKANPRDLRGLPKVFTFVDGSPLSGDATLFGRACAYRGKVDGRFIYDLSVGRSNTLGYFTTINREAADAALRRHGYAGVRVDCADGRQVVLLFQPLPVTEVASSKNL